MEDVPGVQQLLLVKLGPSFQEALLPTRQLSSQHFNYINAKDHCCALIVRVQMRPMMASPVLGNIVTRMPKKRDSSAMRQATLSDLDDRLSLAIYKP
jgi:hypothetical protein